METEDQDVLLRNVDGKMVPWELRPMSEPKHTPVSGFVPISPTRRKRLESALLGSKRSDDLLSLCRQARPYVAECARSSESDGTRTAAQQFLARLIRGIEAAREGW